MMLVTDSTAFLLRLQYELVCVFTRRCLLVVWWWPQVREQCCVLAWNDKEQTIGGVLTCKSKANQVTHKVLNAFDSGARFPNFFGTFFGLFFGEFNSKLSSLISQKALVSLLEATYMYQIFILTYFAQLRREPLLHGIVTVLLKFCQISNVSLTFTLQPKLQFVVNA